MPAPTIYRRLQPKLQSVRNGLAVTSACSFGFVIATFILMGQYDAFRVPGSYGVLVLVGLILGGTAIWLLGVAEYGQEPWVWRVPLLGRLHRALVSRPTPWGEAMSLNGILAFPVGMIGLMYAMLRTAAS